MWMHFKKWYQSIRSGIKKRHRMWFILFGLAGVFAVSVWISRPFQTAISIVERPQVKQVEIKGAVVEPGIYELSWDATVGDALSAAGGVSEEGDLASLNQTRQVLVNEVIVVPQRRTECISINTASLSELDRLPGIGKAMAERILTERERMPFLQLEDLKRVKGIGDKTFEKLRDQICL